ncbi:MAG TPA: FecR domain-containing protein [Chitinispirillaceae bacterium]|nr:FecR domain-containing protein [Chitinispirillaceae bacterium]
MESQVNMPGKFIKKIIISSVYIMLSAAICWQFFYLYKYLSPSAKIEGYQSIKVSVDGNVRKPGIYQIPQGTTHFEILKVAGIRPTSDLSGFYLSKQLDEDATVNVGTLENAVDMTDKLVARLEFYLGEINIVARDGRNTAQHEGLLISKGDRILTEASSQAEISIGANSRIDIDNFSELTFDKIGEMENDRNTVELFQKSGTCWYKTVYTKKESEIFRIMTHCATLAVGASGADFLVDVHSDYIQVNLMDGLILLERSDNSEAINLISGQSVTVYKDGRPFEVTRLSSDLNANDRFSQLNREKINYMSRLMPFNLLFCGTPTVFYVISIQYETSDFHLIRIAPELLIEHFSQGISTISQAYLYGGPVFVSTFLERILDLSIPKYCVFDKNDIIRTAGALGGIQTSIDEKAASILKLSMGPQKLVGKNLMLFLSPSISGVEDCGNRQSRLIESLFNGFRSKTISMSLVLAEQILTNTETNFLPFELMEQYGKFNARSNWKYVEHNLPVRPVKRGEQVCFEPILEKCKEILKVK